MNILLITPGINKKFNDNYFAYDFISKKDNRIFVISQREHINKGKGTILSPVFESDGSIEIHRLFDSLNQQKSYIYRLFKYKKICRLLKEFKPDIIFCEELSNMPFAVKIKRDFKIPLVLRVEFAYNRKFPYRTMGRMLKIFKNKLTGDYIPILFGNILWKWANKKSDAIISCFFDDSSINKHENTNLKRIQYVPWPTYLPNFISKPKIFENRIVFVGAFDEHKNLKELEITIPLLFKNTHIKEFFIIGTGEDLKVIENLKQQFPNNIKHLTSLTRNECLEIISTSFLSYSPAVRGGWGFIGDSFASKTPVLVTHNHYDFNDGIDSIVTTPQQIINKVNLLYSDRELYNKISNGGYQRFIENHTAEAVGEKYLKICNEVLKLHIV
jgi:glycosyltransferase involved in cell wall biosynthesis